MPFKADANRNFFEKKMSWKINKNLSLECIFQRFLLSFRQFLKADELKGSVLMLRNAFFWDFDPPSPFFHAMSLYVTNRLTPTPL